MSAAKISETVRELEQALGRCFAACEHFRRGAPMPDARPWHMLEVDRLRGCILIDGVPVPDGARIELSTGAGALSVTHFWGSGERNHPFAMLEIDAEIRGSIPVELRLYDGMICRLAHEAEGRRD